jgi:hypothetical protein
VAKNRRLTKGRTAVKNRIINRYGVDYGAGIIAYYDSDFTPCGCVAGTFVGVRHTAVLVVRERVMSKPTGKRDGVPQTVKRPARLKCIMCKREFVERTAPSLLAPDGVAA